MVGTKKQSLKKTLDDIYEKYHHPKFLGLDPLVCVRKFKRGEERETLGLVAASLAYGRVEIIVRSINIIVDDVMRGDPINFITNTSYKVKSNALKNFKHRFNSGDDIAALCESMKNIIAQYGSIEKCFRECMDSHDENLKTALTQFTDIIKSYAHEKCNVNESFNYLIPSPSKGSACKRLLMYLRWMIRDDDGVDFGVWKSVDPKILIIPVDTHVAKIAQKLGLTNRKIADWKMAEEITDALRKFSPNDPVKYDFSLCHYGMVNFRKK